MRLLEVLDKDKKTARRVLALTEASYGVTYLRDMRDDYLHSWKLKRNTGMSVSWSYSPDTELGVFQIFRYIANILARDKIWIMRQIP